ncbi:agmatine deiminase [Pseudomonas sp. GV085]|nr:agmatine deiminase [Pseudomonas sp. GV085]
MHLYLFRSCALVNEISGWITWGTRYMDQEQDIQLATEPLMADQAAMEGPTNPGRRPFNMGALVAITATAIGTSGLGRLARAAEPNPTSDGYRVPAEWEPHQSVLMAYPYDKSYKDQLKPMQDSVINVANAIAQFEPVLMMAMTGNTEVVRKRCGPNVTVIEYPYNDCWTRDTAPVFALSPSGHDMLGRDFIFNGWGNRWSATLDDQLPVGVCATLNVPKSPINMVFEGGAVITDGQGTLITTEQCLLNPNRNPSMTKAQIETTLLRAYNASKMIWLPYGVYGDDGAAATDGHVDLVAAYVEPAHLLLNYPSDPSNPNVPRMAANLTVLQQSTDARGRPFKITKMPVQPTFKVSGLTVENFSYINFYKSNVGIVVPTSSTPADEIALNLFREIFPGRPVVGVDGTILANNGGGVHCITQHIPSVG